MVGRRAALPLGLLLALASTACEIGFTDRGYSFVADNRSEIAVLARITRNASTESGFAIVHDVVELPGMTRVVIASQSISGDPVIGVDVITKSCDLIGSFAGFVQNGALIRIDDGPTATLVREWPNDTEPKAAVVELCPIPDTSSSPEGGRPPPFPNRGDLARTGFSRAVRGDT